MFGLLYLVATLNQAYMYGFAMLMRIMIIALSLLRFETLEDFIRWHVV